VKRCLVVFTCVAFSYKVFLWRGGWGFSVMLIFTVYSYWFLGDLNYARY